MPLRCGILTIGTWDLFFPSSCFSGQNEMFSATKQNQTYNHSFFFFRYFSAIRLQSTSVVFILHYRGFHCLRYSRCRLHRYFLRCPFRSRVIFVIFIVSIVCIVSTVAIITAAIAIVVIFGIMLLL